IAQAGGWNRDPADSERRLQSWWFHQASRQPLLVQTEAPGFATREPGQAEVEARPLEEVSPAGERFALLASEAPTLHFPGSPRHWCRIPTRYSADFPPLCWASARCAGSRQ